MTSPPIADRRPHVHTEHGVEREDPYYWLRERDDPAVRSYLEAENAHTEAQLSHLDPLRKALFAEMLGRVQEDDASHPVPDGPWAYFVRTQEGKPYATYCRVPRDGGEEQVVLDVNALAEGHDYISVPMVEVSPDHRILAYAIDTTGREVFEIRFLDLERGELLPDRIPVASGQLAWASDSRTVLWVAMDEALRSDRVFRRVLGVEGDEPVFHEPDERFRVWVGETRSGAYLLMGSASSETRETWVIPRDRPTEAAWCVLPRISGVRYAVEHHGDVLFLLTNLALSADGAQTDAAPNLRLMTTPVTQAAAGAGHAAWTEVVEHRDEVQLLDVDAFARHLVLTERDRGQRQLRVFNLQGGVSLGAGHVIAFPESVYAAHVGDNPEFDTDWLRIAYDSLTTPPTTFRYQLQERRLEKLRQVPTPTYNPDDYVTERRTATAPDGTEVPISMVYRKDVELGPDTPLYLYGYGSYGITMDPRYVTTRVAILDRGVVLAIAHVRGGGFLGRRWYESAKYAGKQHTFSDFIACGRSLHASGLSSPARTVIGGGSAGGLLVGAVLNQAPDLCTAAVAQVPFVDVVTTMLDVSIPLTAGEWEEWGDPRNKDAFDWMLAYSPYDNVEAKVYPNLLVVAGLNDPRVQYWEPAKWVARLRATTTGGDVLLLTHMGAGHAGRSGRYGYLEDAAFDYAYVIDQLGLAADRVTPSA